MQCIVSYATGMYSWLTKISDNYHPANLFTWARMWGSVDIITKPKGVRELKSLGNSIQNGWLISVNILNETPVFTTASQIGIFIKITFLSTLRQIYVLTQKKWGYSFIHYIITMYKLYIEIYSFLFIALFAVYVVALRVFQWCYCYSWWRLISRKVLACKQ